MQTQVERSEKTETASGVLEVHPDGYGFLRNLLLHIDPKPGDTYVPTEMIRKYGLREGLTLEGEVQRTGGNGQAESNGHPGDRNGRNFNRRDPRGRNNRNQQQNRGGGDRGRQPGPRLSVLNSIDGESPELYKGRPVFDQLTPIDPRKWLRLETKPEILTTRVMDMFMPIGKGTRGLIVAPPRSGKTILLQHIADGIATNHPDTQLFVLLVDERPEEVTEMQRTIRGQVYASSNDRETSSHVRLAQLTIERAKRIAESGKDVVVLLDSITRLARAYNKHIGTTGRTMSGGLDVKALDIPKRLFGSARSFDEGGSLTIIGTALIETGSRMDDVIFQEFKGTGNMELVLDRKLADRRIFPAIDIQLSGTRKEERLLPAAMLERVTLLRRSILKLNPVETMEQLLVQMKKHDTNEQFLDNIGRFMR